MKSPLSILLCAALLAGSALAQNEPTGASTPSPAASASPSPSRRPRPPVSSVAAKIPPNMPMSRKGAWEERAKRNIEASQKQANIQLIFDGDSITDFWQSRGRKVWAERYQKFGAFDFAISGDLTQSVLWRLSQGQAAGLHPKLIVLMIGTNNMQFVSTPEEIAQGVQAIISEYQKKCPEAVILLQAIFPRAQAPTDPYREKVNATNVFLAKLADGNKVIYTDFGAKFLNADGTLSPEIMPDFLHPSPKGYEIWADAIQPVIDKVLKPAP